MGQGARCFRSVLQMQSILPTAAKFAYSNDLIWKHFEVNCPLLNIFLYSDPQHAKNCGAPVMFSQSTCAHTTLHSACVGGSGRIWQDQCGCSELLS